MLYFTPVSMSLSPSPPTSPSPPPLSLSFQNLLPQGGGRKCELKGNFHVLTRHPTLYSQSQVPDLSDIVTNHAIC